MLKPIAVLLCLLAAGCSDASLYTNLTEQQVNEMIAVLNSAGIQANKFTEDNGTWQIKTSKTNFASALATLKDQGLPRGNFADLGTVFKKEGFVSSPLEEHARLMYGLSQELAQTLSNIDGVIIARVHLAVPENDPLTDKPKMSAASVFIKYRSDVDLNKQIAQIKALVVNSVEGLPYDNVTVMLFPAQPPVIGTPPPSSDLTNNILIGLAAALAIILTIIGLSYLRSWLVRKTPVPAKITDMREEDA
jgi:type III secretion protein J